MKNMHPLTKWVIDKIEKEYKDDVALLIGMKGHATDGDGHGECFDYFVPATDRAYELEETFIIDGVGHDLYARSIIPMRTVPYSMRDRHMIIPRRAAFTIVLK